MRRPQTLLLSVMGAGLLALSAGAHLWLRSPQTPNRTIPSSASSQKETLEATALRLLPDYKHWTRANKKPHRILSALDYSCSGIIPASVRAKEAQNPHMHKFIVAYVNNIGRQALTTQLTPQFPVGSVVVKAKLKEPTSPTPELCTVMLKREAGYNPTGGDWEYFVADGTGTQIQESGKIVRCMACHAEKKETDCIFRNYLPDLNYRQWAKQNPKAAREFKAWQQRHPGEYSFSAN